jgi:hypothetical protein
MADFTSLRGRFSIVARAAILNTKLIFKEELLTTKRVCCETRAKKCFRRTKVTFLRNYIIEISFRTLINTF